MVHGMSDIHSVLLYIFLGTHILSVWVCPSGWFVELFFFFSFKLPLCIVCVAEYYMFDFCFVRYCILIYVYSSISIGFIYYNICSMPCQLIELDFFSIIVVVPLSLSLSQWRFVCIQEYIFIYMFVCICNVFLSNYYCD